jgi:hypothetical protein
MSISETGADNEKSLTIANSSVSGALIGVEGSGGNRFVGSAVNNMFMGTTGADGLEFATNNTVRMVYRIWWRCGDWDEFACMYLVVGYTSTVRHITQTVLHLWQSKCW